jgi:hypothetical protein
MSEYWRTDKDTGERVLVDQRPDKDWHDGYDAGRRYYRRRLPAVRVWSAVVGAVLVVAAYWLGRLP